MELKDKIKLLNFFRSGHGHYRTKWKPYTVPKEDIINSLPPNTDAVFYYKMETVKNNYGRDSIIHTPVFHLRTRTKLDWQIIIEPPDSIYY
jgi:hypothetical protein